MNSRRVHKLVKEHFPEFDGSKLDWVIIGDINYVHLDKLEMLIDEHIRSEELLVEIHRKLGDFLPKLEALQFIAPHIGKYSIKITNRNFPGFVFVANTGVATGWPAIFKGEG